MAHIDPDDLNEYGIYGKRPIFRSDGEEQTAHVGHWQRWLNHLQATALSQLGEYFAETFGDAEWPDIPPFEAPEGVKDASTLFTQIIKLRRRLAEGDIWGVMQHAHHVGMLEERGDVRWAEAYTQSGRERQADRRRGGAATRKLNKAEERICVELMQEEISKGTKPTPASQRVAARLCITWKQKTVSGKTVLTTWKKSKENA
jgi:hypothetical protein